MNREERRRLERLAKHGREMPPDTELVGRRLPGVNLTPAQREGSLGEQVNEVLRQAGEAAEPLPEQAGHVPTMGALAVPEGAWGVFCLRCSADAQAYIYPCKIDPSDWPPRVVIGYPEVPADPADVDGTGG